MDMVKYKSSHHVGPTSYNIVITQGTIFFYCPSVPNCVDKETKCQMINQIKSSISVLSNNSHPQTRLNVHTVIIQQLMIYHYKKIWSI